jgi:hypothetical protein
MDRLAVYLNILTFLFQEMVIDKVNGQDIPRYLAYDIIRFDGCDVGRYAFYPVRLGCIEVSSVVFHCTIIATFSVCIEYFVIINICLPKIERNAEFMFEEGFLPPNPDIHIEFVA